MSDIVEWLLHRYEQENIGGYKIAADRIKELERRERIYRRALNYYARVDRNVAAEALAATETKEKRG